MRPFAATLAIALAPVAYAQFPSGSLNYECRATTVQTILADLSGRSKVSIEAVPELRNEVLVISVADQPLETILKGIAQCVEGDWRFQNGGLRLVVDADHRKKTERKERQAKLAAILEGIKDRAKKADQNPLSSPEGLITKLLQGIDASALVDLGPNGRIVFSTEPTRMQLPLGSGATEQIDAFVKQHNANIPAASEGIDKALSKLDANQVEAIKSLTQDPTKTIGQIQKVVMVVTKLSLGILDMTQIQLKFYDPNGRVAFSAQSIFTLKGDEMSQLIESATSKKKAESPTTPIEYSTDSKALLDSTKGMMMGSYGLRFTPELLAKLLTPTKYDPLSFDVTDELLAYAKAKKKPLIACVPDTAGGLSFGSLTGGVKTVESIDQDLHSGKQMILVDDSKFLILAPSHPSFSRSIRLDRVVLETLLKRSEGKQIPSLDDLADYAKSAPDPAFGGIGQMYLTLLVPGGTQQSLEGSVNWNMLRLYAQLSPDTRIALRRGAKVLLGNLSPDQRICLESIVYGANSTLTVARSTKQETQPSFMKLISGASNQDYRDEPTEAVPNGITSDGTLDLNLSQEPFAFPINSNETRTMGAMAVLDADELAIFRMLREDKNMAQLSAFLPKFGQMKVGTRDVMTFVFHIAPDISAKQVLKDHRLPDTAQLVTEDNLPSDFQKLVNEKLDAFKKSPLGALTSLAGLGGRSIRP